MSGIDVGKAYVRIEPTAKGIGNQISDILNKEAGGAGESAGSKIASGIGLALKGGGAVIGAGVAAATAAVVKFGQQAVSSYANYEQLIGGVEKLYGDAAGKIEQFANDAYKTSGMSANQYMETATSFSAALINSLGGDVNKAADMTDVAMRAMSDNVNVFGSDMGSVQNAFMGFAKQNYTMLDNLKLGYGGTKTEMERLIADANEYRKSIGETADLSIDSFADVVQAIQSVQEAQNIAGTTNKEAMSTIEGSATATKAAWENLITTIGRGEGIKEAFDGLLSSLFGNDGNGGLLNNIIPRIQTVMEGIGQFIAMASPYIVDKLLALVESIVPPLMSAGNTLLLALVDAFVSMMPMLISTGASVILELVTGISQALPTLIPAVVDAVLTIADGLIDNIDLVIDAALQLMIGLATGIINALPRIVEKAPVIVEKLALGLIGAIPKLVLAAGQLIASLANSLLNAGPRMINAGINLVNGLRNGFVQAWNNFVAKVREMANNLINSVKNVFKIQSPSKVFAQIGDYCVQGFDNSFDNFGEGALSSVEGTLDDLSAVSMPTFDADMAVRADASAYRTSTTNNDLYGLLAQYLPLLERQQNVNVSLEGDAQGLFRQVRKQTNQFIKSTGASPFLSPV